MSNRPDRFARGHSVETRRRDSDASEPRPHEIRRIDDSARGVSATGPGAARLADPGFGAELAMAPSDNHRGPSPAC